nr:hypothetical protein [Tanacetum cinerariifolium]
MAEPNNASGSSRRGRKRAFRSIDMAPDSGSNSNTPCGACKFLRRRCVDGCIFAPYFSPDHGAAMFAAVHKVFGASNVAKQLMQLPVECRDLAALTISYEAQARLVNPVHGCVSTIIALQQVVAALQMELFAVQTQLFNSRPTVANTLHGSLQQPEPVHHLESQPIGSPALTNTTMNDSSLPNVTDHHNHVHPHPSFDPFQLSRSQSQNSDNDEENQDFVAFLDHILQSG